MFSPADRTAALQPTAVNSVLAEVRALLAEGRDVVSLMRGEPDLATPPHIVEAAVRSLQQGRTAYPDNRGEPRLREAVADKLERRNGVRYDPGSEILITDGATFGIYAALMTVVNPGDGVLLPDPVYDAYQSPIRLAGGVVQPVVCELRDGRFRLTVDALETACTGESRVLLINSPWNPTGTVLTREELSAVCEFAVRRNLTLISDEIYETITYGGRAHVSPASLAPEVRERTVTVNSLSKTYAMTGWRVGYCAAPASLIRTMFLVLQQSSRGPATFVQDAGTAALSGPQDCVAEMRETYTQRRQTVLDALIGLPGTRVLPPEGGFFAMLDVRATGMPSNELRRRLLREHGVVVLHGGAYGPAGEGTLRVSFATGGAVLDRGLERLRAGLSAR
ncbi:MAG: pyridoxal phosphate-dependent aminotransferase [Bryobacterales bacterium]|nr:pyridoxal phosphate-dependent aminotransferase [Bryobacterales bacterium]